MPHTILASTSVLALLLIGCRADAPREEWIDTPSMPWVGEHLGRATEVELHSLDGSPFTEIADGELAIGGWKALVGTGSLAPEQRLQAKQALQAAIAEGEKKIGDRCFMPHHALVAEHDGHRLEIVLCFTCKNAEYFWDGVKRDSSAIGTMHADVIDDLLGNPPRVGGR